MSEMIYPFGSKLKPVMQKDRSSKKVFVLGVYASAVHARWYGPDGKIRVRALAVASEPEIFWQGDEEEAQKMLAEAKKVDAEEDALFGVERRGDELPEDLGRRAERLKRLQEAKARLEREAVEAAKAAREHCTWSDLMRQAGRFGNEQWGTVPASGNG